MGGFVLKKSKCLITRPFYAILQVDTKTKRVDNIYLAFYADQILQSPTYRSKRPDLPKTRAGLAAHATIFHVHKIRPFNKKHLWFPAVQNRIPSAKTFKPVQSGQR